MQYAIIENNTIVNVAEADAPLAENWELLQAGAGIGWARTEPGGITQRMMFFTANNRVIGDRKLLFSHGLMQCLFQ